MKSMMFVGFEISPVVENAKGTIEAFDTIEAAAEAANAAETEMFWSLYGRLSSGTVECIADRKAFEDATSLYTLLTGMKKPVEPGRYIDLPARKMVPVTASRIRVRKVLKTSKSLLEEAMHVHVYGEADVQDIPEDSPYLLAIEEIRQVLKVV